MASLFIVLTSSLAKESGNIFHPIEILFFRHLFGLLSIFIFIFIFIVIIRKFNLLQTKSIRSHGLRAILGSLAIFFMFYSVQYLSITEATSLFFLAPLFVSIISYPLLKEKVGLYKGSFIIVGLIGALIILQPEYISSVTGAVMAILAAIFSGLGMICLRWIGKTEDAITTIFYYALIGALLTLPALPFFWIMPNNEELLILISIGILSSILQYFFTKSFIHLPANVAGAMIYMQIIWAIIIDLVIWGILPSWVIIIGASIIICSNLFILKKESKAH